MTDHIILCRNPVNKSVGFVDTGDDGQVAVFESERAALEAVPTVPILRAFPWQIVELNI